MAGASKNREQALEERKRQLCWNLWFEFHSVLMAKLKSEDAAVTGSVLSVTLDFLKLNNCFVNAQQHDRQGMADIEAAMRDLKDLPFV